MSILVPLLRASDVPTSLDVAGIRTPLGGEGYLAPQKNPPLAQWGEEWTGWVDVRHPGVTGTRDVEKGYDRSDRFVNVQTTFLMDNGGNMGVGNPEEDFDFANRAYMLQTGVSVLKSSVRGVTSPVEGEPGSFHFPLQDSTDYSAVYQNNSGAPVIDTYYGTLLAGYRGVTRIIKLPAPAKPVGIIVDGSQSRVDTFGHELFHFLGAGDAVHLPIAADPANSIEADPAHSSDPRNLIASGPIRLSPGVGAVPAGVESVGPRLSDSTGGVNQLTSAQAQEIFTDPGAAAFFPNAQRGDNGIAAGGRVDWDFVVDHAVISNDHDGDGDMDDLLSFGVEGLNGGADNHQGEDAMYWGIGNTIASDQTGKDKQGLGEYAPLGDFAGESFRYADVFSIYARYSDEDVGADGNISLRESLLDYDLSFVNADGVLAPGVPVKVFTEGWTNNTTADNYLARWESPFDAVGLYIKAEEAGVNDGTTHIDAVIVAVPEPSGVFLWVFLGFCLALRRARHL